ncbi:Topoisomerase 1-associated factor 1 [Leucoagaricus sp. SymC.cos]|nr:Topoisomerase 1-associated factor 1 [Leucoagaricus sp. SymC.cos]
MATSQVIDLTKLEDDEGEESQQEDLYDPRDVLGPVITRIIDALGGVEEGEYRMGEQVGACLKDLKKLWRRDDTDDDRTVARFFWERRLLQNDLLPILLTTIKTNGGEDKRAIACIDLMTAMTWPIDLAEELKELDEEEDKNADFTHLLESHLHYKASLVNKDVLKALFSIVIPPLSKAPSERTERDFQLVSVVLYLIRNLAFVKDLRQSANLSTNQQEFTSLQSRLIQELEKANFIEFIITIAANTEKDPWLTGWNTIALEILYLLYRGVSPISLSKKQEDQPKENLRRLLDTEARLRREVLPNPSTRHSRFGTTISVTLNPNKKRNPGDPQPHSSVLHRQQALNKEAVEIMDIKKRQRPRKGNTVDELSREDNLSVGARKILQALANEFLKACFNSFVSTLLKDIRLERARVTEKDKLRLLFVTKFFLEYFLALRAQEETSQSDKDKSKESEKLSFGLIAEVVERNWIVWVLKRMREAVDEKPKLWTELQAGLECLTQLLLLIDIMSRSDIADPTLAESADLLQQQIIYNGEVLDIAIDSLRAYREGSQSLTYLNASVHLSYALMRLLERWSKDKGDGVYVRKKTARRRKKAKGVTEEEGIPDAEEDEIVERHEDMIQETIFTFDAFEMKFANAEINQTLLTYLARYKEFDTADNMRRVVSLLHRQAVKAKAEGLFFNVSTLDLFKTILSEKETLPRDQPYKDLINLINFILRKFFKALAEDTFLAVEAFFPKNRGYWKQYSSWEPEDRSRKDKVLVEDRRFPPDVRVKKGYSWSDQLGIVIAALAEAAQTGLITWAKEIIITARDQRRKIITDNKNESDQSQDEGPDDAVDTTLRKDRPSAEALEKIKDYVIPYLNNEHAQAATKNPQLKLLFRLCKFAIMDEDEEELQWYIPAAILPSDLQGILNVFDQFLETPFDLGGKKASSLLAKKRRRRRQRAPPSDTEESAELEDDEPRGKRKEKKKKEEVQYKSAQFIEDSDEEYGDMDAFLEKEKALRDRVALAGAEAASQAIRPPGMRAHGMKKRRRRGKETEEPELTEKRSLDFSESSPSSSSSEDEDFVRNGSDSEAEAAAAAVANGSGTDDLADNNGSSTKALSSYAAVPRPTRQAEGDSTLTSPTSVDSP